jgi:hypothetical protein
VSDHDCGGGPCSVCEAILAENARLKKGLSQRLGVRCQTCAMSLVGLPTPGYPHAPDCAEAERDELQRQLDEARAKLARVVKESPF